MLVMANRTLSHSSNISVNDYQSGEKHTHTQTSIRQLNRSTRGTVKTPEEPADTELEIQCYVWVCGCNKERCKVKGT